MAATPVAVEVWRGERVESRHRVRACVADADGRRAAGPGRHRRARLPALGGQAVPGPGPGRERCRRRVRGRRRRSWRWPAPRMAASRIMWPWSRPGSARLGLDETALACGPHAAPAPAVGRGPAARRHGPAPRPQQLLGQACRHAGGGLAAGRTDPWLRAAAARRAAPLRRCDRGPGRPRPAARARASTAAACPITRCRCAASPVPRRFSPTRAGEAPIRRAALTRIGAAMRAQPHHGRRHRPLLHRADGGCSRT